MSEERKKILKMVADGKITPDEADRLLGAMRESEDRARFLRVRIFNKGSDNPKVKVDLPVSVIKLASKIGAAFKGMVPEGSKINVHGKTIVLDELTPEMIDRIMDEITEGGKFSLVQVDDEEKGEHVEVYIE
jgi:hypothetical protein